MAERLRPSNYLEVYGNKGIDTQLGKLSVGIQPASLQQELIAVTNNYNPDNFEAKQTGRERSGKLVCILGGNILKEVLLPRFEKILTANGTPKDSKELSLKDWGKHLDDFNHVIASSFVNPFDTKEYLLYFNLPGLIQARNLKTREEFIKSFKEIWIHERHHFAQYADTAVFMNRIRKEGDSLSILVGIYMLCIPLLGGWAGFTIADKMTGLTEIALKKKMSRRGLLKGIGGILGLAGGAIFAGYTYSPVGYNLQYNILPTSEHEARDAAQNTNYTVSDLEKTFQFSFSPA